MDIFDRVMQMEKEGESLYRGFANQAPEFGMKKIFNWLADQELKHYETFKKMKEGKAASVPEDTVFRNVRDIFEGWKKTMPQFSSKTPQAEIYHRALETEQKSAALYEEQSKLAEDQGLKAIWLQVASEEKSHERILENIIEFVTRPDFWAENAEFSHLEENYYL